MKKEYVDLKLTKLEFYTLMVCLQNPPQEIEDLPYSIVKELRKDATKLFIKLDEYLTNLETIKRITNETKK